MGSKQLHKRLNDKQVKVILENYLAGEIDSQKAQKILGVKKSQFYLLLKNFKDNPEHFSIRYERKKPSRKIKGKIEKHILYELKADKRLVDDKNIPIRKYNYSAIRDNIIDKHNEKVSVNTIISRAKKNGYYIEKKVKKIHDRKIITNFAGELIQHDSSHHQWSPYMSNKLYLITSLDDYSRLILYADMVKRETVWKHIKAIREVILKYGCPLKYYTDQHSIFRFVQSRDKFSLWKNFKKFTDDVNTQFKQVLVDLDIEPVYALSPQAKGKVERPYQWIQDRIVRTAAKNKITKASEIREILKELVYKYNNQWIHSTTREIPIIRYEKAILNNQTLFKPFKIIEPYQDVRDIFCIKVQRVVNNYRKVYLDGEEFEVPKGIPREDVELKIVPSQKKGLAEIRFWQDDKFLGEQKVGVNKLRSVRF